MPIVSRRWLLMALLTASGCASPELISHCPCQARGVGTPNDLVIVVDGVGDLKGTADSLRKAVAKEELPLDVEPFLWSHGYMRMFADNFDKAYAEEAGHRLAATILARQESDPGRKIYLVGHSAGAFLVLTAAKSLPPDAVERIVLLEPGCSYYFDVRPGLLAARQGVDVFYSWLDVPFMCFGAVVFGTSDRAHVPAAGFIGFKTEPPCAADAPLYAKLRQYPWHPAFLLSGHFGDHFGVHADDFVCTYVLPMLSSAEGVVTTSRPNGSPDNSAEKLGAKSDPAAQAKPSAKK